MIGCIILPVAAGALLGAVCVVALAFWVSRPMGTGQRLPHRIPTTTADRDDDDADCNAVYDEDTDEVRDKFTGEKLGEGYPL